MLSTHKYNFLPILIGLTILFIAAQCIFFAIHYQFNDILDTLLKSSIRSNLFVPALIIPVVLFIAYQLIAYALLLVWLWYVIVSSAELGRFSARATYWLAILYWCISCVSLFTWNSYFYPNSFFAESIRYWFSHYPWLASVLFYLTISLCVFAMALSFLNTLLKQRHYWAGNLFLIIGLLVLGIYLFDKYWPLPSNVKTNQPNIIIIGLDSVRPDFINEKTPHIQSFLQSSIQFKEAYTPLARTNPAWMSLLTAQHPKHSRARMNLLNPKIFALHQSLVERLNDAGYETIFGTDESRYAAISVDYGFQRVFGPIPCAAEFILAGLSDFPLTNLLINLPFGRFVFPYHYANRAAAITYQPNNFLVWIKAVLRQRKAKPLFLALHFCLAHWPYTWSEEVDKKASIAQKYQHSVSELDKQLAALFKLFNAAGILNNSIVFLLSDHGTTLGLPNDRLLRLEKYQGDLKNLIQVPVYPLSHSAKTIVSRDDLTLNTSYGQATDVLSLKQNHIVLAFKDYRQRLEAQTIDYPVSLLDVAPTILSMLKLLPLEKTDGDVLLRALPNTARTFYFETADTIDEIETEHINPIKVLSKSIQTYQIDSLSGRVSISPEAERKIILGKQRAIMQGDWFLAYYPARRRLQLLQKNLGFQLEPVENPAYFIIFNLKSGKWDMGTTNPLAKSANIDHLTRSLTDFYVNELKTPT